MTPDMLDYFFNIRTACFRKLGERERALIHTIYDLPEYHEVLPDFAERTIDSRLRHHRRFSFKCPGRFRANKKKSTNIDVAIEVIEVSRHGFVAHTNSRLSVDIWGEIEIQLGKNEVSRSPSCVMRDLGKGLYSFQLDSPDLIWRKFLAAISKGSTKGDLDHATYFLDPQ